MQRRLMISITALCLLLAGCATTIQSEVTAFHDWPADLRDKSFVFERSHEQENNLEYNSYENLVRDELRRLGFIDAADSKSAKLKVAMQYSMQVRDVRVVQPVLVDPYWYGSPFYGYGRRWPGYGYYGPFYDPFWYGPPIVEQRDIRYQLFTRQLKIGIAQASDFKKLYDVTVNSEGTNDSLAAVMPYMVRSAFADFPGRNGVPRRIEMRMNN